MSPFCFDSHLEAPCLTRMSHKSSTALRNVGTSTRSSFARYEVGKLSHSLGSETFGLRQVLMTTHV